MRRGSAIIALAVASALAVACAGGGASEGEPVASLTGATDEPIRPEGPVASATSDAPVSDATPNSADDAQVAPPDGTPPSVPVEETGATTATSPPTAADVASSDADSRADAVAPPDEAPTGADLPIDGGIGGDGIGGDGDGGDATVEVISDEPSFDIGPPVDIDLDLARFPVDDAGLGGGAGTPEPDGPDGPVEDPSGVTGWAGVDRFLESVLIRPGNTAASVAVSIDGDVVHAAAFGVRDPATGDPAEPNDRFRIASISKTISAIVALTLVDDGTLSLDEPVGQRIADHVGLGPLTNGARDLTLAQLLGHRSGFARFDSTFFRGGADDCVDAARTGLSRGAGGGGYVYSNMNYCLVGLLIEAVTELSYEEAVYRRLLGPLGITGMRLAPTVDPGPDEIQHVTTPGRNYMETLGAAGAWIATPTDLVTILDSLDLSTPGFKPLTQQTTFRLVVPVGGAYGQRGYGLGVISYGDGRFGHTGTIESTHAMVLDRGDGVVWAITVAGSYPGESTGLEQIMNRALVAGGFVTG